MPNAIKKQFKTNKMKQLKLEHISGYLPCDLNVIAHGTRCLINPLALGYLTRFKPILKPMTKEVLEEVFSDMNIGDIQCNSFNSIISFNKDTNREVYWIKNSGSIDNCPKWIIDRFHKHHVDYQGLIGQGLAINETTLK